MDLPSARAQVVVNLLTWAGSVLVAGSGILHFFLWLNYGYRHIPTIGPLFLMQAIVAVLLAVAASASRLWLVVLVEAGFVTSSAGGLIISINIGLFGWQEASNGPWVWEALVIELAASAILIAAGGVPARHWLSTARPRRREGRRDGHTGALERATR
ncbi:MAG TPA: hypothetical protein VME20_04960 [Acidimicrobiales bacterium]|nr:hypothetical protein [Acidimicrobiales bacterium]